MKQTRGLGSWTVQDLAQAMRVSPGEARRIAAVLELQGYAKSHGDEWTTTSAGYEVSGSKLPRLKPETVERALRHLSERIKVVNGDRTGKFRVVEAVAFGDFMNKAAPRIQAADVGVRLAERKPLNESEWDQQKSAKDFLKRLRGRSAMLNLLPYEDWMGQRSHLRLL